MPARTDMTVPSRLALVAAYALVAVALWSPPADSALAGLLRYALYVSLSGLLVPHTYVTRGIVVSRAPEWLLLIAFLCYVSLSALWSEGSTDAAIKAALVFTTLLVSVSLANAFGLDVLLRIFFNTMCVFVLLSLFVVIFFPERGIETGWLLEGDWRGIAGQKNGLGAVASMVFVLSLALPVVVRPGRRGALAPYAARLSVTGVAALCMVNSGSRGALLLAGVGLACIAAAKAPRAVQRVGLVALVLLALPLAGMVAATLQFDADKIGVLGATIDSNSRMTLWLYGLGELAGRELFGMGVGGFWTDARIVAFKDVHGWVLDNFHNGYVTILVEGGLVGILLLVMAIGFLLLLYVVTVGNLRDSHVAAAFALAGMFTVGNMTENEIGRSTSMGFLMFMTVSFALRLHVERTLAAGQPAVLARHPRLRPAGAAPAL